MELKKNLTVGIVGAGEIVSKVHLPVLLQNKKISVQWITDANPIKAKLLASSYKVPFLELVENLSNIPYTDIVLLAIPYGNRESYYNILKGRQSALYVEKPFARSVEEHQKICSYLPSYKICCGFQRRCFGPTQLIKKLIENTFFGSLEKVSFRFGRLSFSLGEKHYSDLKTAGGGILFEFGIHGIDTLLFSINAKEVQIEAAKMLMDKGFDIHTEAKLKIKTKTDNIVDCEIVITRLQETTNSLEFYFKDIVLSFPLFELESKVFIRSLRGKEKKSLSLLPENKNKIYPSSSYQVLSEYWEEFIKGIHKKEANFTSAYETMLTTETIEKLYNIGINKS